MAPPNTSDSTYLDTQLDAMTAQLAVLSFAPVTVTSALTDRFPSLNSSVFENLAQTLCSHSKKLSGLVNNDPSEKLSHHIKFDKESPSPLSYCDVIYDNKTKQCTLLLKMKEAEKFEGSFKRATKQIAIQIDPNTGLRFCPVVSLKAKDDSIEKIDYTNRGLIKRNNESVIKEATNEGALKFKCVSGSNSRGKPLGNKFIRIDVGFEKRSFNRLDKERAVQLDKGIIVRDAIKDAMKTVTDDVQKKEEALLSNLCHYMKQIGFQLAQMHQNGHTHFDVKPDNILVRPGEVTRDGQTTAPIYTLIDIPDKKTDPNTMQESFGITYTPMYSPPWVKSNSDRETFLTQLGLTKDQLDKFTSLKICLPKADLCGHMFDSYAFLIGLGEQIAEFDAERNREDFKPFQDFFVAQMDLYLDAALAIADGDSQQWPENLTVSGITQSFTEMIRTNEKCQDKAFLEQAIENAEARNQIPSQPFNTTGVLPKDATNLPVATLLTTSTSTPESNKLAIENLSKALEKLKTVPELQNIQEHIQISVWMKVWDFITSGFSTNSMNRRQAKNILVDFCRDQEVDVTRVIEALTFIEEKKMVREPSALVSLASVINHLRETQTPNPSKDIKQASKTPIDPYHHQPTLDELEKNLGKKHDSTESRHDALHGVGSHNTDSQQRSNDPSLSQKNSQHGH